MNALVKKEIRLLLPSWIVAMLLAIAPLWIIEPFYPDDVVVADVPPPFFMMIGMLFLGIASFGQEISFKTFPLLLSQPVLRSRVWWIKISVLGIAFVSMLAAAIVSWFLFVRCHLAYSSHFSEAFKGTELWIFVFAFSSSGLWTTLLLRQATGAFWVTLFTPVAIATAIGAALTPTAVSDQCIDTVISVAFVFYSIAGFFWARRLFFRAQDTQWTGGEFSFSWRSKNAEPKTASISSRSRHWFFALVRKEFQLHQVNILIAVVLLALHLASVVIRKIHPHFENPNIKGLLEFVWSLWLLMPLLISSAAVAEERKLGVIESQLCLPVSRRAQLFIKFSVALILSLVLGGVMPFVIERAYDFDCWIFVSVAAIFFISFYASTLARSTIQAIGLAIAISVIILACAMVLVFKLTFLHSPSQLFNEYGNNENEGRAILMTYLGVFVLLPVLARLMFWNFKWLHQDWKLWRRNFIVVLAAFVSICILTNAIFYRTWEWLTPIEPPPGPARLSDSTHVDVVFGRVNVVFGNNTIFAILPDGRLWTKELNRSKAQFIGGSNWMEVTGNGFQTLGIQSGGSLWSLQRKWNPLPAQWRQTGPFKLTQIGSETNWSQAAGASMGFLLLKKDGSLWIWGTNEYDWHYSGSILKKLKLDLAAPPARVSNETNWTELFAGGDAYAKRNDGTLWGWQGEKIGTNYIFLLGQNTNLNGQWQSYALQGAYADAGVRMNGELWFFGSPWINNEYIPQRGIQLGRNSKWKAVQFANNSIIAIRDDGTLWEWNPFWNLTRNPDMVKPVQLGSHSDWIALTKSRQDMSLAADGSLWAWDQPSGHIWLAPSRRPVFMGNIFEGTASTK